MYTKRPEFQVGDGRAFSGDAGRRLAAGAVARANAQQGQRGAGMGSMLAPQLIMI